MREIKFQAFVKPIMRFANRQVGFMIDVSDLDFHERNVSDDDGCVYHFNEIELREYTGINDSEGNEIYGGDIIKFSERSINGFISTHTCRVFQSENGAWRVEGHPDFDTSYRTRRELYLIRKKCEVIGNVYENPELLKEE